MWNKLKAYFLAPYASREEIDKKQITALLITLAAIGLACVPVILGVKNPMMRAVIASLIVAIVILIALIRLGHATASSIASSILISLLFASIPFLQTFRDGYELYLLAVLQVFSLVIAGLTARKSWQSLCVLAMAAVALAADFIFRVLPSGGESYVNDLVICSLILVVSTFVERAIKRRADGLLDMAKSEAARSKEHLEKLEHAILSSGDALGLGIAARNSAEATERLVAEMRVTLADAERDFASLAGSTQTIGESYARISQSYEIVHDRVSDQSAAITQSSAAIEEMTASVNSISDISIARQQAIRQLKGTMDEGNEKMASSAEALHAMGESASSILEVVDVIRSVASQTDLLAMNAAIEAAHAGESGRGFSVVAEEIRKLSEATALNVQIINADIKTTMDAMGTATVVNESAQAIFRKVDEEADALSKALEEIARGLSEISAGSGEILQGVAESVQFANTVKDAAHSMETSIRASSKDLETLGGSTASLRASFDSVIAKFDKINAESESLSDAGRKSELALKALMAALNTSGA